MNVEFIGKSIKGSSNAKQRSRVQVVRRRSKGGSPACCLKRKLQDSKNYILPKWQSSKGGGKGSLPIMGRPFFTCLYILYL